MVAVLKAGGLSGLFLPALGPLLYFYVQALTSPGQPFHRNDLLHLCPLMAAWWLPVWLNLISILIYLYLSYRLIQHFYDRLQSVLMDRPRYAFRTLKRVLLLLGVLSLLTFSSSCLFFAIAFVLMVQGAAALLKPDCSPQPNLAQGETADTREKARRVKEAVASGRLYADAELTLATLAGKLAIHPHELSKVINLGLKKNFSDFINEFRVREVIRRMADPSQDKFTLLAIAYESGFSSKTTFNRVFREITGKTPLTYKNGLNKKVPIDKLVRQQGAEQLILRSKHIIRNIMLKNYFKIAYRQLLRQKMYAAIKIGGFALGIAACLLIGLYIHNEMTFDQSYPGADRIFRVVGDGQTDQGLAWPAPLSKALQQDFPDVEFAGRMRLVNSYLGHAELRRADQQQSTYEQGLIYIDQSFFSAFQLPMVFGDGSTALKEPQTMVISKTIADKYYPGKNPLGQVMYIDNDKAHPYRIGGVMADIPANSHLHPFHFFITLSGMEFGAGEQNSWSWFNYVQYVKLKAGTDAAAFEAKMNANLRDHYWRPQYQQGGTPDAANEAGKIHLHLQPVPDINLYSYNFPDGLTNGDIRFVWLFAAIALFILLIASVNFINLSTARSASRAKEVGLRKVVGSHRSSLVAQFLIESLLYSLISFVLSIMIAWLFLPYFNGIAGRSLTMPWLEWWFVPVMLLSAVLVGALAGLYPAFYLSAFKPGQVLKGTLSAGSKSPVLRNGLVVFQFAASVVLIIGTVVIYNQMHFILNRKAGFDKDQVMILQSTNTLGDRNIKSFKNDLSKIAAVKSASISDYLPVSGTSRNGNAFFKEGRDKIDPAVLGQIWQVDDTYLPTLGIKLLEGRNFSYEMASDTSGSSLIINQKMVKALGLKHPIGARISDNGTFTVIGVVADFNYESLRSEIQPVALRFGISNSMMTVKLRGGDLQRGVSQISALWKTYSPNQPIRYTFLDDAFAGMYADVNRMGKLFTSFAALAIAIACLGLFALSAFLAEQRSKEIGIRKVLGASVQGITTLLSLDFIRLVVIAILIASPVAWWAMHQWLQSFAYRITISWWMFVLAGLVAMLIALLTVSFQSVKAALANPVKSLRSE